MTWFTAINIDTSSDDLLHYTHKMLKMKIVVVAECMCEVFLTELTHFMLIIEEKVFWKDIMFTFYLTSRVLLHG